MTTIEERLVELEACIGDMTKKLHELRVLVQKSGIADAYEQMATPGLVGRIERLEGLIMMRASTEQFNALLGRLQELERISRLLSHREQALNVEEIQTALKERPIK